MSEAPNRKRGAEGQSRANKRKYFPSNSSKKDGIPLGSRGILVSCAGGKENIAAREAIDVFTQLYEADHPESAAAPSTSGGDVAALLAAEVADLKDHRKSLFYYHPTGIHSTVFVEIKYPGSPGPCELVSRACEAARQSRRAGTKLCNRFYPVESTCYASLEKIREAGATLARERFPTTGAEGKEGIQFAVQYEHRAAPGLDRMDVINAVVNNIKTPPHKVNLSAPQKTILINVLKTTCGFAVVEDFKQLLKYNIRLLATPPEEEEAKEGEGKAKAEDAEGADEEQPAPVESAAEVSEEKVEQEVEVGKDEPAPVGSEAPETKAHV